MYLQYAFIGCIVIKCKHKLISVKSMKLGIEQMSAGVANSQKKERDRFSSNEERVEFLKEVERVAGEMYGDIPYHNFDHAKESLELGYEIIARCEASGIEVDSDLIRYSLLFHDAGYHENHQAKGFESKEEYSAHLAEEALRELGVPEATIEKVKECIISTHKDKSFDSLEEKIVRAADLVGLAYEYEKFKENAIKIKKENEILSGNDISWDDFKKGVKGIIEDYLSQDIRLTECYKDEEGGSRFHKKTKENLDRFLEEEF